MQKNVQQANVQKKKITPGHVSRPALAWLAFVLAMPTVLSAQASILNGPWSGQAQCTLTIQGPGYSHQEVQTWTLSGGAPTLHGAMHVFPGDWSVSGQGSYQRSQGPQSYQAQWTTNASLSNAPIAIFVRASDGRLIINSSHAQLRSRGGVTGTQQVTINGVPQAPDTISLEAFEWQFPAAGSTADAGTRFSGSKTLPINGSVGPMQPGGSQGTAQCSWQFAAGAGSVSTTPPPGTPGTNPPGSNPGASPGTNPGGQPGVNAGKKVSGQADAEKCSPPNNPNWGTFTPLCVHQGDQNVALTLTASSPPGTNYIQGATSAIADDGLTVVSIKISSPNTLTIVLNISPAAYQGPHAFWVNESAANGNYAVQTPFIGILPASASHGTQSSK